MSLEGPEKKLSIVEKENIVMDANMPEEVKCSLLAVLRDEKLAVSITYDHRLPNLSQAGLYVCTVSFAMERVTDNIRRILREKGIVISDEEAEQDECFLHFVSKERALVAVLENAFWRHDYEFIQRVTAAKLPTLH